MAKKFWIGLAALLTPGMTGRTAKADYALVIGINKYKNAPDCNLQGCVNDAATMANVFKKYHFDKVNVLLNEQATQEGILKALQNAPRDPNQRFVFYFAGHGTDKAGCLVTYNSLRNDTFKDIDRDALYRAVKSIPAKSRTIILDSCFSGAMARGFSKGRTRFFPRRQRDMSNAKDWVVGAAGQDSNATVGGGSGICYYTAAQGTQQSNETSFDGEAHGVFTYFLSKHLDGKMTSWSQLDSTVSGDVSLFALKELEKHQTPTLSPAFGKAGLFDDQYNPAPMPHADADKTTVWDIFNGKHVNPGMVRLCIEPNQAIIAQGAEVAFNIEIGANGYLVVLEYGTSGLISILHPASKVLAEAEVSARDTVSIPQPVNGQAMSFKAMDAGQEQIRAILFTSRKQAATFLAKFGAAGKLDIKAASKDFAITQAAAADFYTSDLHIEVAAP